MKQKTVLVKCPKCNGKGIAAMSNELLEVFNLVNVQSHKGGVTAGCVYTALDPQGDFHVTAFNNRLNKLVGEGLIERKKKSKEWVYFSPAKNKPKTKGRV